MVPRTETLIKKGGSIFICHLDDKYQLNLTLSWSRFPQPPGPNKHTRGSTSCVEVCATGQMVLKSGVQRQQCVSRSPCGNKGFHMVLLSELQRPAKRADHLSIKQTFRNKGKESASLLWAPRDFATFPTKECDPASGATWSDITFGLTMDFFNFNLKNKLAYLPLT